MDLDVNVDSRTGHYSSGDDDEDRELVCCSHEVTRIGWYDLTTD